MAGIFRHSAPASNNNNSNESSPNRRISFGTFSTNPGFLQDVTMDNTYGVGYRSPCVSLQQCHGATSPAVQGHSVREFEEHSAALRKENFNLKLRLYFIEENIPALKSNGAEGCDTAMRELIEHKVEVEMLRRELEEKKTVLKDALQAIEDLEKLQKDTELNYEAKIEDLKQKIQFLEMDHSADKSENNDFINNLLGRSDIVTEHVNNLQRIRELESLVKTGEETVSELENKVAFLDGILAKRDQSIKEFEDRIKSLEYKNAELQDELDEMKRDNASCEELRKELKQCRIEMADKICLVEELEEKTAVMQETNAKDCGIIQALKEKVKLQKMELKRLSAINGNSDKTSSNSLVLDDAYKKKTASEISGLNTDFTGPRRSLSDINAAARDASRHEFDKKIELQEGIIKSLRTEVKKKTADLQNIINKELWEKNREIERLTNLLNERNPPNQLTLPNRKSAANESAELQQSFTEQEYAKALERNRSLQLKVDILIQRLGAERENELTVSKLRHDLREARSDAENAERFRRECADLCAVLTERLEELAGFLNSLLKHKDVLGFLAADRRRAIRKAVDRSLDLSKSLNRTLSLSGVSMTEHSLAQLCNLSEILGNVSTVSIDMDEYGGGGEGEGEACAIETLKAENKALKKELDKRRSSENNNNKKDRRSLPSASASAAIAAALENQSESEAWSEPDRKVSLARIGLEDHSNALLVSKDHILKELSVQHPATDSESDTGINGDTLLNHSRSAKLRTQQQETIAQLELYVSQRDQRILQIQCQLVEADNRLKKENLRVIDLTQEVKNLRERNDQLHADLIAIGTATQEEHELSSSSFTRDESKLLRQIDEQARLLENIQDERDRLALEARFATQKIAELKTGFKIMKAEYEAKLMTASEQEQQHLKEQQERMEEMKRQYEEEQQQIHTETLEQLTELQRQYVEGQRCIDSHIENAKELRRTLIECELNSRALKKQLDESALQASQAIMERTKALNDKMQLEQTMEEYKTQLEIIKSEREALQNRIEELESSLQKATEDEEEERKRSCSKDNNQLNGSDISQSGYTSEEVVPFLRANASSTNIKSESTQRMNNSSPDLGIESDAGRVSSVEFANVHRSLLMKIEMPKSESTKNHDLLSTNDEKKRMIETEELDTENRPPNACMHDCSKVEQELNELRRKLARTKRTLEDTYQKLRNSNQMKAQIEKDIKNQIIKTHNVLKNVRSNMELEK